MIINGKKWLERHRNVLGKERKSVVNARRGGTALQNLKAGSDIGLAGLVGKVVARKF